MVVGQVAEGRDLVVIGGGPGGYEAALHAVTLGRTVTLVDRRGAAGLGGECLHTGCIPSKTLIELAEHERRASGGQPGSSVLAEFQQQKSQVVGGLHDAVQRLVERTGIEVVAGEARFIAGDRLAIDRPDGLPMFLEYRHVILATGSRPIQIGSVPFDGDRVLDSAGVLALEVLPRSIAVVGGGYIGVELGTALAKLGVQVTIVELADQLLPGIDADISRVLAAGLERRGVRVELGATASGLTDDGIVARRGEDELQIEADKVLVAVGRVANTDDVGLTATGAVLDARGLVVTDGQCRATPRIFAIGDVREGPALAHKATAEGKMAVEVASGIVAHRDVGHIPLIVFSDPEVASVGRTGRDVAESGGELVAGKVPLGASGRARTMGDVDGFVRVVAERATGAVVGVQIAAPHASELIATATVLVELGAVLDDLDGIVFAHPTLGELIAMAGHAAASASG